MNSTLYSSEAPNSAGLRSSSKSSLIGINTDFLLEIKGFFLKLKLDLTGLEGTISPGACSSSLLTISM